jgi:SAM-dependent methyltransferase
VTGPPFNDHFSRQAEGYSRHRPAYPPELFEHIAGLAPARDRAWDAATGNGQAAVMLGVHFAEVLATDASPRQLAHARPHPAVSYVAALSESVPVEADTVDATVVGQALHWFDHEAFFGEVRRVSRRGAVLVAWCYGLHQVEPRIDVLLREFYAATVGPYWPPERRHIEAGYRTIPWPFERLPFPPCVMTARWNLEDLLGYLRTWSSVQRYLQQQGHDPVEQLAPRLAGLWGEEGATREVSWPLHVLAGRVER